MLRFILLCIFLQSGLSKSAERNHLDSEEDVTKKPLNSLKSAHSTLYPILTTTETNEHINDSGNDSSNDSYVSLQPNRRALILKLFKNLFTTTEKPVPEKKFEDMAGILQKLIVELNSLNNNLKTSRKSKYVLRGHSKQNRRQYRNHRIKRNVTNNGNETTENTTVVNSVTNNNNVATNLNSSNVDNEILNNDNNVTKESANNETNSATTTATLESPIFLNPNSTQPTESLPNGRRSAILFESSSILKEKLLIYLDRMFNDIDKRIKPVTEIKVLLSDAISYRIGYIIANIDMLQVQLKKMKSEMAADMISWSEAKVQEVFNKVKTSSDVVSNLLDILSSYMPQSTQLNGIH